MSKRLCLWPRCAPTRRSADAVAVCASLTAPPRPQKKHIAAVDGGARGAATGKPSPISKDNEPTVLDDSRAPLALGGLSLCRRGRWLDVLVNCRPPAAAPRRRRRRARRWFWGGVPRCQRVPVGNFGTCNAQPERQWGWGLWCSGSHRWFASLKSLPTPRSIRHSAQGLGDEQAQRRNSSAAWPQTLWRCARCRVFLGGVEDGPDWSTFCVVLSPGPERPALSGRPTPPSKPASGVASRRLFG
jgi:hypothetical protein